MVWFFFFLPVRGVAPPVLMGLGHAKVPGYGLLRGLVPETTIERVRDRWRPSERPVLTERQRKRLAEVFDADLDIVGKWLGLDIDTDSFTSVTTELVDPTWQPEVLAAYPVR